MSVDIPTFPRRVKVYELDGDQWIDNGTGYCSGVIGDEKAYLSVKNEANESELLLRSHIRGTIQYQKQQSTLIVWSEPDKKDIALSFQEADGCDLVCDFLAYVQRNMENEISIVSIVTNDGEAEVSEVIAGPVHRPPEPKIGNLGEVVEALSLAAVSPNGRDSVIKYIHETHYISQLVELLEVAEDLESLTDLHNLCRIMKILFLMNDNGIFESLVSEENLMGVVGMLEYDPDFPNLKANHRNYLADESRFNEVIPIPNIKIRQRIKQTFKLQFLKDVVLARLLDDPTFSLLTSMIYFNQIEIIGYLQEANDFSKSLFKLYTEQQDDGDSALKKKRDGVRFIHQLSLVAKGLGAQQRSNLYTNLIKNGLFLLIHFALKDSSTNIRILGTELMVTIIDYDSSLVRKHLENYNNKKEQENNKDNNDNDGDGCSDGINSTDYSIIISRILIDLLLNDEDIGLRAQATEAFKILISPPVNYDGNQSLLSEMLEGNSFVDNLYDKFYSQPIKELMEPLIEMSKSGGEDKDYQYPRTMNKLSGRALYEQLCEILSFCMRHHVTQCANFMRTNNLWIGIRRLIRSPYKQCRVAAIKCVKHAISLDDESITKDVKQHKLIGAIFDVLLEIGNQNNLIHSSCLELFYMIDSGFDRQSLKRNARVILNQIVDDYSDQLTQLDYTGVSQMLLSRYHDPIITFPGLPAPSVMSKNEKKKNEIDQDDDEDNVRLPKKVRLVEPGYYEDDDEDSGTRKKRQPSEEGTNELGRKRRASKGFTAEDFNSNVDDINDEDKKSSNVKAKRMSFKKTLTAAGKKLSNLRKK